MNKISYIIRSKNWKLGIAALACILGLGCGREMSLKPVSYGPPETGVTPSENSNPPASQLVACAPSESTVAGTCQTALFSPRYCLDFESADELQSKGAKASGTVDFMPSGRSGHAARPTEGTVSLPFGQVVSPEAGTISLWVAAETAEAVDGYFRFIDSDRREDDPGFSFSLVRQPNYPSLEFYFVEGITPETPLTASDLALSSIDGWRAGEWHHLAITWSAGGISLYIDGQRRAEASNPTHFPGLSSLPDNLYLLSSNRSGNTWPASGGWRVDSLRSYDKVLLPEQIAAVYQSEQDGSGPSLNAGRMRMTLLGPADGFGIQGIMDAGDGRSKTIALPDRRLWEIDLQSTDGRRLMLDNLPSLAARVSCQKSSATQEVFLTWEGLPIEGGESLDVRARLLPNPLENEVGLQVRVENFSAKWRVQSVTTRLNGLKPVGDDPLATDLILPGPNIGSRLADPFHHSGFETGVYPGNSLPMPWCGLADEAGGGGDLYIGAHDGHATMKKLRFQPSDASEPALDIGVVALADRSGTPGNDHLPDWYTVIGLQEDGWFGLAGRYRRFAVRQAWAWRGPLSERALRPRWMEQAGIFHISSGSSIPLALQENAAREGAGPGFVFWHFNFWQEATSGKPNQTNDTPAALPAPSSFDMLQDAHEAGMPSAPYFLPTIWDAAFDSGGQPPMTREEGEGAAIRDPEGKIIMGGEGSYEDLPVAQSGDILVHEAKMCPSASAWQSRVQNALRSILDLTGVRGVYLDVLGMSSPERCHGDPVRHHHEKGSNDDHVKGYHQMLGPVRDALGVTHPDAGFYTEGFADPYLDLVDGYLTLYPALDRALPLAIAVYHDYAAFIGPEIRPDLETMDAMMAKEGRFFTWGGLTGGLIGMDINAVSNKMIRDYLIRLGFLRQAFQEYLVLGSMKKPPHAVLLSEVPSETGARLSPVEDGPEIPVRTIPIYNDATVTQKYLEVPAVMVSAWKGAGGKAGLVVTSIDPQARSVWIALNRKDLGLEGEVSRVYRIVPGQPPRVIGSGKEPGLRASLLPYEIVLLEVE